VNKKVLILSTENSCRSIIAEALLNKYLHGVDAVSAGIKTTGKVNLNAKKLLEKNALWIDEYHSKKLTEVIDENFDLVVMVCDNAIEPCPIFKEDTRVIHIGYENLDEKNYSYFEKTIKLMKMELTPIIRMELGL
jgi:arsenate reductase